MTILRQLKLTSLMDSQQRLCFTTRMINYETLQAPARNYIRHHFINKKQTFLQQQSERQFNNIPLRKYTNEI